MTTIEQFVGLHGQMNEVLRRVGNGSLDAEQVKDRLQAIIEKREPRGVTIASSHQEFASESLVPSWYISPERQLERVRQLNASRDWGFSEADFPSIPRGIGLREGEMLLLCVYLPGKGRKSGLFRTFDELWKLPQAPPGFAKWRWPELRTDSKRLRQVPGYKHTPGLRWVVFNPNSYRGMSPEAALEQSKADGVVLAGTEGLMALMLFPGWATSWNGSTSPSPWLTGLQFYWNTDWSRVPYLGRWDGYRQLRLSARWADYVDSCWASPSVGEC